MAVMEGLQSLTESLSKKEVFGRGNLRVRGQEVHPKGKELRAVAMSQLECNHSHKGNAQAGGP